MSPLDAFRNVISFADLDNVQLDSRDFWPSDVQPEDQHDQMDGFLKRMDPLVHFLETAAFALPEYGIIASAYIGVLWGAIQPSTMHMYQEPVETMIANIVEAKLQSADLASARSHLDEFNHYVKDAIAVALPKTDDEVAHSMELAKQFGEFVNPGGLLTNAFISIKNNLPWFNSSVHSLLISALQNILQAYKVRLMCLQAIAFRARSKDDVHGYNEAQHEVCSLLDRLQHHLLDLQAEVEVKIDDLKLIRRNSCTAEYDTTDANYVTDHRHHSQSKYRTAGWVKDSASNRKLLRAELVKTSGLDKLKDGARLVIKFISPVAIIAVPDGKADGSDDDAHFGYIMDEAVKQYKERLLPPHIDEPFVKLLKGVQKVVDQSQKLTSMRKPGQPEHGPVFISGKFANAPKQALAGLEVGDAISYRFTLHVSAEEPELQSSPWSPSTEHVEAGMLQQVYIGDGYAAMETTRKIYRRTSEADAFGILVDTITGRGILTWPVEVDHGAI